MVRNKFAKRIISAATVTGFVLGLAAPAFAEETSTTISRRSQVSTKTSEVKGKTVDALKAEIESKIDLRLTRLDQLTSRLNSAKNLEAGHKSTLQGKIDSTRAGLQALRAEVAGETDITALRTDGYNMIHDYRVFVVLSPQVHITVVADREVAAADLLDNYVTKLQEAIDKAKANGKDTAAAQAALDQMKVNAAAVRSAADGVADTMLALTPAGYPDNASTIEAGRTSLKNGHASFKAARTNAQAVRDALKAL